VSDNYRGRQGLGARWRDQVMEDVKESKELVCVCVCVCVCVYKRSACHWIEMNGE
jgi:hypothetical protein